jgi:hypothetical protein
MRCKVITFIKNEMHRASMHKELFSRTGIKVCRTSYYYPHQTLAQDGASTAFRNPFPLAIKTTCDDFYPILCIFRVQEAEEGEERAIFDHLLQIKTMETWVDSSPFEAPRA